MAEKATSPAMDFIVQQLQKDPSVAYRDIAAGADKKGLEVYPIMYGRAKAMLGLVPTAPRGQGKKKRAAKAAKQGGAKAGRAAAAKPANGRRGGRGARERAAAGSGNALDEIIGTMREEQRERERYRKALEQIRAVLENL